MVEGNPLLNAVTDTLHADPVLTEVTVGTSEVALPPNPLRGRKYVMIQNKTGSSIFIGPSGVTTTVGVEIASGATERIALGRAQLYAIKASGSGSVFVLEFA